MNTNIPIKNLAHVYKVRKNPVKIGLILFLTLVACLPSSVFSQFTLDSAIKLNEGADSGENLTPHIATDEEGTWIAVWASNEGAATLGSDQEILFSRSTNDGFNWTAPVPLNLNAGSDDNHDRFPQLATDRQGNWVAVWLSLPCLEFGCEADFRAAYSNDNGETWSLPSDLPAIPPTIQKETAYPFSLVTNDSGRWIVATSFRLVNGINVPALALYTSDDNGASWEFREIEFERDFSQFRFQAIHYLDLNKWGLLLGRNQSNGIGYAYLQSTDNAETWRIVGSFSNQGTNGGGPLAADRDGNLLMYSSIGNIVVGSCLINQRIGGGGPGLTSCYYNAINTSSDSGQTWSLSEGLNGIQQQNTYDVSDLKTDTYGNWVAVSGAVINSTVGLEYSTDMGATWQGTAALGSGAHSRLATDRAGTWFTTWAGGDSEIWVRRAVLESEFSPQGDFFINGGGALKAY